MRFAIPPTLAMDVEKAKVLRFPVSADEIDAPVRVLDGLIERRLVLEVDGDEEDLTQIPGDFKLANVHGVSAVGDDNLRDANNRGGRKIDV